MNLEQKCVSESYLNRKASSDNSFRSDLHFERLAVALGEKSWIKARNELQRNEPGKSFTPRLHEELKGCLKLIASGACPIYNIDYI